MDNDSNDPILPAPKLDEGYGGVYWYQQGDVEACHLLTQASKRVKARRMAYGLPSQNKGSPTDAQRKKDGLGSRRGDAR